MIDEQLKANIIATVLLLALLGVGLRCASSDCAERCYPSKVTAFVDGCVCHPHALVDGGWAP